MAEKKITELPSAGTSPTDSTLVIGQNTRTYKYTFKEFKEGIMTGLPYKAADSGTFIKLKPDGNTNTVDEAGDWKLGIDSDGNFAIDYFDGTSWKNKQKFNKG